MLIFRVCTSTNVQKTFYFPYTICAGTVCLKHFILGPLPLRSPPEKALSAQIGQQFWVYRISTSLHCHCNRATENSATFPVKNHQ